jgi:hypothetical protein
MYFADKPRDCLRPAQSGAAVENWTGFSEENQS